MARSPGTRTAAAIVLIVVAACASPPTSSPTSSPTTSQTTSPAPSAPAVTGDRIVVGLYAPPFVPSQFLFVSNAFEFRPPLRADVIVQLVHNGLYRYNESLEPVPDLAAEPCTVAADAVTITCTIVETTFHDGTPLTADDVVYTYELVRAHPRCGLGFGTCLDMLETVTATGPRTVEFRLNSPNATFFTLVLPNVMIDSRRVVEASYKSLADRTATLSQADFEDAAAEIEGLPESETPDCEAPLAQAEQLLASSGLPLLPRDHFNVLEGQFDPCLYAEWTGRRLRSVAESLDASGFEAVALAYPALSFNRNPVGTGPFRMSKVEGGSRALFDPFDGYHFGRPAAGGVDVRIVRAPDALRAGLENGEFDWAPLLPAVYQQVKDMPGLQIAAYPDSLYFILAYNLRPGSLFAEHALRSAVELCIDKPATVDAATSGTGDVIYSPIDPISWAFQPDLRHPERDIDAARAMIESAGWTVGADGVYERQGRRLAADVYVSADDAQRTRFVDLVAEQVRDCGMELTPVRADSRTVLNPLFAYPHIAPGADKPFEAVFIAFAHGFDPHDPTWSSEAVTSEDSPDTVNFMGFANSEVDRLLDEGIATYDQRERARIYRQFQEVLAEEQPVLFAWGLRTHEALDSRLRLTDGEINLESRMWWWQLEKLTLAD